MPRHSSLRKVKVTQALSVFLLPTISVTFGLSFNLSFHVCNIGIITVLFLRLLMCLNLTYNPGKCQRWTRHPECAGELSINAISYTLPQLCKVNITAPILQVRKLKSGDILKVIKLLCGKADVQTRILSKYCTGAHWMLNPEWYEQYKRREWQECREASPEDKCLVILNMFLVPPYF